MIVAAFSSGFSPRGVSLNFAVSTFVVRCDIVNLYIMNINAFLDENCPPFDPFYLTLHKHKTLYRPILVYITLLFVGLHWYVSHMEMLETNSSHIVRLTSIG